MHYVRTEGKLCPDVSICCAVTVCPDNDEKLNQNNKKQNKITKTKCKTKELLS